MSTTPVEPTIPQTVTLSSVDELREQAQRLGLTWDLRAATVAETTGSFSPYNARIIPDGDTSDSDGITAVSFMGGVAVNMRVMVMHVPPVGSYMIGSVNSEDFQHYERGGFVGHPTGITNVEQVMETFPQFVIRAKAAYRWQVGNALLAGTTSFTRFYLRKTNVAGASMGQSAYWVGVGLAPAPLSHVAYFVNNTDADIVTTIVCTAVSTTTSTWLGSVDQPRFVSIQYVGPAVEYPFAVAVT